MAAHDLPEQAGLADRLSEDPWPGERWDLYCAMPSGVRTILDVGCGEGRGFGRLRTMGVQVVGVDFDESVIQEARKNLDEAVTLDVESGRWPAEFLSRFDVVAFCDCLEHLRDPWSVLRSVRSLLAPRGLVVASIPNVRQIRVLLRLAFLGRWDYLVAAGTVQRDHLRFFTRRTCDAMFAEAGYERPRHYFPRRTFHLGRPERFLHVMTAGLLRELLYGSFTVSAAPLNR